MNRLPVGEILNVRPAPLLARTVPQQFLAYDASHAAAKRCRKRVLVRIREAELHKPRKTESDRRRFANGAVLWGIDLLCTGNQAEVDELGEPFPGLVLSPVANGQEPKAAFGEPTIATVQHSLNVAQLNGEDWRMPHS